MTELMTDRSTESPNVEVPQPRLKNGRNLWIFLLWFLAHKETHSKLGREFLGSFHIY